MKTLDIQLITVGLENGEQGVFIGTPLIFEHTDMDNSQVENIWFSNVQELPDDLTLKQLMELVQQQLCACGATVQ